MLYFPFLLEVYFLCTILPFFGGANSMGLNGTRTHVVTTYCWNEVGVDVFLTGRQCHKLGFRIHRCAARLPRRVVPQSYNCNKVDFIRILLVKHPPNPHPRPPPVGWVVINLVQILIFVEVRLFKSSESSSSLSSHLTDKIPNMCMWRRVFLIQLPQASVIFTCALLIKKPSRWHPYIWPTHIPVYSALLVTS
jgi:hypothetical protein